MMATSKKGFVAPIFLDLQTLADVLALSVSTAQDLVRKGQFPQPRQLSGRRVGWLLREVQEWAEARPVSMLPPPPNTGAKKPRARKSPAPLADLCEGNAP